MKENQKLKPPVREHNSGSCSNWFLLFNHITEAGLLLRAASERILRLMSSIKDTHGNVKLEHALRYARLGFYVFPVHSVSEEGKCSCGDEGCQHPGKHPRIMNWQNDCSIDPEVITGWWKKWPDANVAIATGKSGLVVIDIDPDKGGKESFLRLKGDKSTGEALLVHTGGGGQHGYYLAPEGGVKNFVGVFPGIDVRGNDGYVIAPPSIHKSGKSYKWGRNSPENMSPGPIPAWLLEAIITEGEAKRKGKSSGVRKRLSRHPSEILKGVQEGERDVTIFRYACDMRVRGYTYEEAKELVLIASRNCEPPFPDGEGIKCLDSAWKYQKEEDRAEPISFHDLSKKDIPDIKYIVQGLLPQGVTLLSGDPKVGKSWLAMQMAVGVANGTQILGFFDVTDGASVLHLALEDSEGLFKGRLQKLVDDSSCPGNAYFINSWPTFPKGLSDLRAYLEEREGVGLVVIDCLESIRDPKTGNATLFSYDYGALKDLRGLAAEFSVAILVIHHTRKMASDNPLHKVSGSQGLTAAADQVMVLEKNGNGRARLTVTGRAIREETHNLSFDADSCTWTFISPDEATRPAQSRIKKLMKTHQGRFMGAKEISKELDMGYNNVRALLSTMLKNGSIVKVAKGKYTASAF